MAEGEWSEVSAKIVQVFRDFDKDGNGVIQREELAYVLSSLGEGKWDDGDVNNLLETVDRNNDGRIQYEEFVAWITADSPKDGEAFWGVVAVGAQLPRGAGPRLGAIVAMSPHLADNHTYKEAKSALDAGDEPRAEILSDRLLIQLESDANRIDAAFLRFDFDGTGHLNESEIRAMLKYLGFPDPEEDPEVQALLARIDKNSTGKVEKEEFKHFVEVFGGCDVLFARRREKVMAMRAAGGSSTMLEDLSEERLADELTAAGIDPDARAYWELVLPPSELHEVVCLTECQKMALSNIRHIAKVNHAKALPKLQERVVELGYKEMDLWTTLSWVRDFAPLIVHVHFDRMVKFFKEDTHYRSQFETGKSCGLNNREVRERWERSLFQGAYDGAKDFERPKYGVLNVMDDYRGVVRAKQYGDGYLIMKDTRLRATFSPEDSANLKAERLASLDCYAHVLNEYSDTELKETLKVATSETLGTSDAIVSKGLKYKEAQFHGELAFAKHVERMVLPREDKYTAMQADIDEVCAKHGWQFSWMDEEKERREALQESHTMDGKVAEWKAKLKSLSESRSEGGARVPEGYCIQGCGRKVAEGTARSGKPFKTCCRGCAMGFGHDLRCGLELGVRIPCKMGCGCLAASGVSKRGRPLDTCCRGCVRSEGHDARCAQEPVT